MIHVFDSSPKQVPRTIQMEHAIFRYAMMSYGYGSRGRPRQTYRYSGNRQRFVHNTKHVNFRSAMDIFKP